MKKQENRGKGWGKYVEKYNGRYYESEYEQVFIKFLEQVGWTYTFGKDVNRIKLTDVLIKDDFEGFVAKTNPTLNSEEVKQIYDIIRLAGEKLSLVLFINYTNGISTDYSLHHRMGWLQ